MLITLGLHEDSPHSGLLLWADLRNYAIMFASFEVSQALAVVIH